MRKGLWIVFAALLISGGLTAWKSLSNAAQDAVPNPVIAWINGEPLTAEELGLSLQRNKASVIKHFKDAYGADDSPDFWETAFNGEVPIQLLKQKSLDESSRIKIQQMLAREKGIVQDISYAGFLGSLEKENNRRKEALQNRQVIYGPAEYSKETYYDKLFSDLVHDLQAKLASEWTFPDQEIEAYYEAEKNAKFKKTDSIRVNALFVPFGKDTKEEARQLIDRIKQRLDDGEPFDQTTVSAVIAESGAQSAKPEFGERTFDKSSVRMDMMRWPRLLEAAKKLSLNQISDVVEESDSFYLIQCVEKQDMGYEAMEGVKDRIKSALAARKYEKWTDAQMKEAKIEIDQAAYNRIRVE